MPPKVSIVIICKNEEKRIRGCLESAKWADEIVVCDDESTDSTLEIVKEYTSVIVHRKMDIEGRHRNFAYSQATGDWVLSLDADERVTAELVQEIRDLLNGEPSCEVYSIPIKTYIHGRHWIAHSGYYPAPKARLFKKGHFQYEDAAVHPKIIVKGTCGTLKSDIIHYGYRSFQHFIYKFNRETTLEAEKWIKDGRKVTLLNSLRKTVDRFLKNYILKKGYKDGFLGYFFCCFHGFYQLFSYAKYWEMKVNQVSSYDEVEQLKPNE